VHTLLTYSVSLINHGLYDSPASVDEPIQEYEITADQLQRLAELAKKC